MKTLVLLVCSAAAWSGCKSFPSNEYPTEAGAPGMQHEFIGSLYPRAPATLPELQPFEPASSPLPVTPIPRGDPAPPGPVDGTRDTGTPGNVGPI